MTTKSSGKQYKFKSILLDEEEMEVSQNKNVNTNYTNINSTNSITSKKQNSNTSLFKKEISFETEVKPAKIKSKTNFNGKLNNQINFDNLKELKENK